jgi:hypothetical protein
MDFSFLLKWADKFLSAVLGFRFIFNLEFSILSINFLVVIYG